MNWVPCLEITLEKLPLEQGLYGGLTLLLHTLLWQNSTGKEKRFRGSHVTLLSRASKQGDINLINCMFTKKLEEFINSKIKSVTGSRVTFRMKGSIFL